MKIQSLSPAKDAVDPELKIDVALSLRRDKDILLGTHGTLWCGDKKIGTMHGGPSDRTQRRLNISRSGRRQDDTVRLDCRVPLSRRALTYIEEQRDDHPRGDVELELKLCRRTAELSISTDHEILLQTGADQTLRAELYAITQHGSTDMRVVSTGSDRELLHIEVRERTLRHTISSSDWAQEFCPALGVGHFLTFDYQVPEHLPSNGEGKEDLEERLADAITSLDEMQNQIQAGEWNQATQNIRGIAELIRNHQNDIASLLERDEIEAEAASEITEGMQKLFDYASKFVHREDRSGNVMPRSKASKEDAYLAYTVGTAVVNLIAAKLKRTQVLEGNTTDE